MLNKIIALFLVAATANAANLVQTNVLRFGAAGATYQTGTVDPSVTATTGTPGSVYINSSTGLQYIKQDSGSTTNWFAIGPSAAITRPVSYTPTITGAGTVTNNIAYYQQIGSNVRVYGSFTTGTVVAALTSISLPSGLTLDTTRITINNNTSNSGMAVGVLAQTGGANFLSRVVTAPGTSTNLVYVGGSVSTSNMLIPQNGSANLTSNFATSYEFTVPVSGLSGAIETSRTPIITPWTAYTPTFTGFGTVTVQNFRWRQVGESIQIQGRFTAGTSTAVEARISLPNNYTSSSAYSTLEVAGIFAQTATGAASDYVLIEPSVQYITFGLQGSTNGALSKINGNSILTTGQTASINATINIAGLGGVISSPGGWKTISVGFANEAAGTNVCSTSPCVIITNTNEDNAFTSVTRSSTGVYVANIASGVCGSRPSCAIAGNNFASRVDNATATTLNIEYRTSAGAAVDVVGSIVCRCKIP